MSELLIESFLDKEYEKFLSRLHDTLSSKPSNKEKAEIYSKILFISSMNLANIENNRAYLEVLARTFDLITDVVIYDVRSAMLHMVVAYETKCVLKPFAFCDDRVNEDEFAREVFNLPSIEDIVRGKTSNVNKVGKAISSDNDRVSNSDSGEISRHIRNQTRSKNIAMLKGVYEAYYKEAFPLIQRSHSFYADVQTIIFGGEN